MITLISAIAAILVLIGAILYINYYRNKEDDFDLPRDKNGNPIESDEQDDDYDDEDDEEDPLLEPLNELDTSYSDFETFEDFLKEIGIRGIISGMIEYVTGDNSRLFVMLAEMQQSNPSLKTQAELAEDAAIQEVFLNTLSDPIKMTSLSQRIDMTDYLKQLKDHSQFLKGATPAMKKYAANVIEDTLDYQKEGDRFENRCYVQFMCTVKADEVYGDTPEKLEESVIRKAAEKLFRQIDRASSLLEKSDHALAPLDMYGLLEVLYKVFNRESSVKVRFEDIIKSQRYSLYVTAKESDQIFKEVQQRIHVETKAISVARDKLWELQKQENNDKIKKGEDYYVSPVDKQEDSSNYDTNF